MRLLVAGSDRVDAGKTTFSTGLLDRIDGTGFKPRAGNDYWFDQDGVLRAIGDGRLYGKDAKRLAAASADEVVPEDINPIHRLWRPSPGPDGGLIGAAHRRFVLDRVAGAFVRNGAADVPDPVRERLPLADAPTVSTVDELNDVTRKRHLPALDAVATRIDRRDRAVVESYGDIARPLQEFTADAVAVVEPARARIYDGDRYGTACEAARGSAREGTLEQCVEDVIAQIDPVASVGLPALGGEKRTEPGAVADAYSHAYDELLAVAE